MNDYVTEWNCQYLIERVGRGDFDPSRCYVYGHHRYGARVFPLALCLRSAVATFNEFDE